MAKRRAWMVAVGLTLLAGAAGYGVVHGFGPRPVSVAGPPSPLPPCTARADTSAGGAWSPFWVGVDKDPVAVTAIWWPTMNDSDCHILETQGNRTVAAAMATAIRSAPPIPTGRISCPNDVGGAVDLYFSYAGHRWELVRVKPTGCAMLADPGRKPRQSPLSAQLAALAPPGEWTHILH